MTCRIVSISNNRRFSHPPEADLAEILAHCHLYQTIPKQNLVTTRGNYKYSIRLNHLLSDAVA
jgi:hypothetical protein